MKLPVAIFAVLLVLAGLQVPEPASASFGGPVQVAYQDDVQRYDGGQSVQRSTAPRRAQPSAEANPRRTVGIG